MIYLKGPLTCDRCPQKTTVYTPSDLDCFYPYDDHECRLTERNINRNVAERTVNKFCPLWVNTEWPL